MPDRATYTRPTDKGDRTVAIVVEGEPRREALHPAHALAAIGELGWFALIGASSLGAGAIHAAAIGVHSEHRQAVICFTIVAAIQLGFGAVSLARPGRVLLTLGAVANVAIIGGWVMAKTNGIGFIDGLEEAEDPQLADSLAAGLAMVAVVAVCAQLLSFGSRALGRSPRFTGGTAIVVAALALPGMVSAGSHSHSGGHGDATAAHGHDDSEDERAHRLRSCHRSPTTRRCRSTWAASRASPRSSRRPPRTCWRSRSPGFPQFADPAFAEAQGFVSIGDGFLGYEHYLSAANMNDDKLLDPDHPESLVFDTQSEPKRLVAAMFMMDKGDTLDDVPELGGKLTQWHVHDNLCFAGARVAGLTDADGQLRARPHARARRSR